MNIESIQPMGGSASQMAPDRYLLFGLLQRKVRKFPKFKENNDKMEARKYAAGGYHTHAYTRNRKFHYFMNLREPKERYLFNLEKDRDMNQNIAETNPADLAVMEDLLKKSMDGWQLPEKMGGHSYTMPYIPFALKS